MVVWSKASLLTACCLLPLFLLSWRFCCLFSILCCLLIRYLFVVYIYTMRIFVYSSLVLKKASWPKRLQYIIVFNTQEKFVLLIYINLWVHGYTNMN